VVKADAYGHGAVPVAEALQAAGADGLCVATLDEALELRRAGIDGEILVLYPVPVAALPVAAGARISLSVTSEEAARDTVAAARSLADGQPDERPLAVHLEIETGLTRDGVRPERAALVAAALAGEPRLRFAGIWSHLATPDDEPTTERQVERFEAALAAVRDAGIAVPLRHLAASGGLLTGSAPMYDAIRPGLAVYGVIPAGLPVAASAAGAVVALRPALRIVARAVRIEDVPAGTGVSYGATWVAQRPSRIATLPLGYGDGFARAYGGRPGALVRGRRVPLVGAVAMDALMVDVTDVDGLDRDDEFVLLGRQGDEEITVAELAAARATISWEVLATMARRIPRVYYAAARAVRVRTLEEDRPA
jgi:alanine racemase